MASKKNIEIDQIDDSFIITTPDEDINNIIQDFRDKFPSINVKAPTGFNVLLLYIYNNYIKSLNIKLEDINLLDYYFMIYTYICSNCDCIPFISKYSTMIGIDYNTIKEWMSGDNRSSTHTPIVKKWREFGDAVALDMASKGSIGGIYISKAIYNHQEQAQQQIIMPAAYVVPTMTLDNIGDKYKIEKK